MMIYCAERELENLRISFQALKGYELRRFYMLLAMRQVFTTPPTVGHRRRYLASFVAKVIWCMPAVVHYLVVSHDRETLWIFQALGAPGQRLLTWESRLGFVTIVLTIVVLWNLVRIDLEWNSSYRDLFFDPPTRTSQTTA